MKQVIEMNKQELRDRLSAIHKKVREDPEIIERKCKQAKRLGTLSQEQLNIIICPPQLHTSTPLQRSDETGDKK